MKSIPDDRNEIHDYRTFRDKDNGHVVVTCLTQLSAQTMLENVGYIKRLVQSAHKNPKFLTPDSDPDRIQRAQIFEEGTVFMVEKPFTGYPANRYLMDFFDVKEKGICSRMHCHTGLRYVRIMTGPDTTLRISSLSPMEINGNLGFILPQEIDDMPDMPGKERYSVIVPPNSIVDAQIPGGVSHQFNADGPNAVIDSVHPEEASEVKREKMSGFNMLAETFFLSESHPKYNTCRSNDIKQYFNSLQYLFSKTTYLGTIKSPGRAISPAPHMNEDGTEDHSAANTLTLRFAEDDMPGFELKEFAAKIMGENGVEGVRAKNNSLTVFTTNDQSGKRIQEDTRLWRERIQRKIPGSGIDI